MKIGQIIKTIRIDKGLKQKDLVEKTKLSKSYISKIEKGTKTPRLEQMELIGKALDVPIAVLFLLSSGAKNTTNQSKERITKELGVLFKQISKLFNTDSNFDSSEIIKLIENEKLLVS